MSQAKVLIVVGSPRSNGNSATLAQQVADGVKSAGGQAEIFNLHKMNIKPCDACDKCQDESSTTCAISDDMQELYPKLRLASALVIASPIYVFTVSAQTKLFMDRCRPLWSPHNNIFKDMPIGILLAYADPDPFSSGAVNAIRTFQDACSYLGSEIVGMVYGSASKAGEIRDNTPVMDRAFQLGKLLAGTG